MCRSARCARARRPGGESSCHPTGYTPHAGTPLIPAAIVASMSAAKPRRVRLPAAERRAQLIRIAQEVYLDLGIDRTSVLKVARAAGVNNATIYQHFSSTAELFEEAVLRPLG